MNTEMLGYIAVGGTLVYQFYVTSQVMRVSEYSRGQRMAQAILIWVVPILGAVLCRTVLYTTTDRSRATDQKYLQDDPLDGLDVRREGRGRSHHRDAEPGHDGGSTGVDGGGD